MFGSSKLFLVFIISTSVLFAADNSVKAENCSNDKDRFKKWKEKHNKNYGKSVSTETAAFMNFKLNLANIEAHNKRSNETYKQGTSSHSDLSYAEKKSKRMGLKVNQKSLKILAKQVVDDQPVRVSVNYTNFLPPVKDQKNCGACWSFAAVAVLEFWIRVAHGNTSYSEQNLIDCDTMCQGCDGGWPTDAFKYIKDQGISDGTQYKYKAVKQTCKRTNKKFLPVLKIPNACEVSLDGNEQDLKKIISQHGPVAAAIAATEGFTNYKSGIFYDKSCSKTKLDHAITIVGYGSDSKKQRDYWIIRNSWGTTWGMNGYGLMARNCNNSCGIAFFAMFPC